MNQMPGHVPLAAVNQLLQSRKCASENQWELLDIFKLIQQLFKLSQKLNLCYSKNFEIIVEKFRNQEVAPGLIQCYETG